MNRTIANFRFPIMVVGLGLLGCRGAPELHSPPDLKVFSVGGLVRELKPDGRTVVIQHEAIPGYMEAMSMPFRVRHTNELTGLQPGDAILFRLSVNQDESWIDQVTRKGRGPATNTPPAAGNATTNLTREFRLSDIPDFALTNEFGQPLSLRQFHGRAVALTFFFTRCPIPEYCPRLTRNFLGASQSLQQAPDGPTNYHFLSISFDPVDTPALLRSYARQYGYDSNHWSFVTGNLSHIRELAQGFGVPITGEGVSYTHGFTTAIFDAGGRLHRIWPIGGDMTDQIVAAMREAALSVDR